MSWSKGQVRDFVKRAKGLHGQAWSSPLVTDAVREAILARVFVGVVTVQMGDTLKTADVDALWTAMLIEAGLVSP